MPEGRSALFVAICVVVLGSVALGAAGLAALRAGTPPGQATGDALPTATASATQEAVATLAPLRTTTPIPTQPRTPTPEATVTPPEEVRYIVVGGDVLERIAQQFGVSPEAIAERNSLVPPYRLEVGQVLVIPNTE